MDTIQLFKAILVELAKMGYDPEEHEAPVAQYLACDVEAEAIAFEPAQVIEDYLDNL